MNAVALLNPGDPAELGYPATLPIEVALKTAPIADICAAYGLSRDDWNDLRVNPLFVADLAKAVESLKRDGMRFRVKAQMQSEELLKTSWRLIHAPGDEVPPAVKADLIKFTIRSAGLDGSKDQGAAAQATPLQIQINLG